MIQTFDLKMQGISNFKMQGISNFKTKCKVFPTFKKKTLKKRK